jgi:hypothetical protein
MPPNNNDFDDYENKVDALTKRFETAFFKILQEDELPLYDVMGIALPALEVTIMNMARTTVKLLEADPNEGISVKARNLLLDAQIHSLKARLKVMEAMKIDE